MRAGTFLTFVFFLPYYLIVKCFYKQKKMRGILHLADLYLSFVVFKILTGLYNLHVNCKLIYIFRKEEANKILFS